MVQLWIDLDESVDLERLVRSDLPQLRRMALFDAVINNADRKGGHLLPVGGASHIFGIDHGISFHNEDKLRTLLWGWRGRKLSRSEREVLERLRFDADLDERLLELLTRREVDRDAPPDRPAAAHRRLPVSRAATGRRFPGRPSERPLRGCRARLLSRGACLASDPASSPARAG